MLDRNTLEGNYWSAVLEAPHGAIVARAGDLLTVTVETMALFRQCRDRLAQWVAEISVRRELVAIEIRRTGSPRHRVLHPVQALPTVRVASIPELWAELSAHPLAAWLTNGIQVMLFNQHYSEEKLLALVSANSRTGATQAGQQGGYRSHQETEYPLPPSPHFEPPFPAQVETVRIDDLPGNWQVIKLG